MFLKCALRPAHLAVLLLMLLTTVAAQCSAPPSPPLPATPTGPVIRLALLMPTSGEQATFGRMARNGSIMAFDEWNKQGGVLGHRLEWAVYDTACDFESGRQAAQQAIADNHHFIIGPLCSAAAIGAATVVETANALMISPTATHPLVTVDGQGRTRPTIFRASYVSSWQAQAMAHFATDTLKLKRVAILAQSGDEDALSLADAFAGQFTAQGGHIVYRGNDNANDTLLTDTLTAIHRADAQAIYLPANAAAVNRVAAQVKSLGLKLVLLGSDSWETPPPDLSAASGSYFTAHFALDENPAWAAAYKATYAVNPTTLAALSYEAASILVKAMQQTGAFDDPPAVAKTLAQGRFNGVTGQMSFNAQHNPIKSAPIIYIDSNRLVFLTAISP